MKKNLTSLSDFIDQEIGVKGTTKRTKFDEGFEASEEGNFLRRELSLSPNKISESKGVHFENFIKS
jgi:hypothetical protein